MNNDISQGCQIVNARGHAHSVALLHAPIIELTYQEAFDKFSEVNNDDAEIDFRDDRVWRIQQICKKEKPTAKDLEFLDLHNWIHPCFLPKFNFKTGINSSYVLKAFDKLKEQIRGNSETKEPTLAETANAIFRSREKLRIDNAAPVWTELGIEDKAKSNSLSTSTYEATSNPEESKNRKACSTIDEPLKTPYPKAENNRHSFEQDFRKSLKENANQHESFFELNDLLYRCQYYTRNKVDKDWHVNIYTDITVDPSLSASVYIKRQPFSEDYEIEMLKLVIIAYIREFNSFEKIRCDQVIFNGI